MSRSAYDKYADHASTCSVCADRRRKAEQAAALDNPPAEEDKLCEYGAKLYRIMKNVEAQLAKQDNMSFRRGVKWR